jgi:hypothetical protein
MRTYLLIIALAALAAAQATQPGIATQIINLPDTIKTTIDEISYSFVKQRRNPVELTVPLPAVGYKDYGKIRLLVVAIPYSPEENFDQIIHEAINILLDSKDTLQNRLNAAMKKLLSIRSTFYPYETFKVRLIFIMFVDTQSLISYALDAVDELAKQGGDPQQEASTYFTNTLFEILALKYEKWTKEEPAKIKSRISSITADYALEGNKIIIRSNEGSIHLPIKTASKLIEQEVNGQKQVVGCEVTTNLDSGNVYENYTLWLGDVLLQSLSTTIVPNITDLKHVFAGKIDENKLHNFGSQLNQTLKTDYSSIIKIEDIRQFIIINFGQKFNKKFIYNCTNCDSNLCTQQALSDLYNQLVTNGDLATVLSQVKQKLNEGVDSTSSRLGNCFQLTLALIRGQLMFSCQGKSQEADQLCNTINQIVSDAANIGTSILQSSKACAKKLVETAAEAATTAALSSIPGANAIWMLANGIFGALQNQITITGLIESKPLEVAQFKLAGGLQAYKIYSVTDSRACYAKKMQDINTYFRSTPSFTEGLFAALKGFLSAVTQLYAGPEAGNLVDQIPIIRWVDIPQGGYFMFTATPGIYVLTLSNIEAKSIIDDFTDHFKRTIRTKLSEVKNIILDNIKKGILCGIYNDLNTKIAEFISNNAVGSGMTGSTQSSADYLTLNMYFAVVPPFLTGRIIDNSIKYDLNIDIFGLLRSFLFKPIGTARNMLIEGACGLSTQGNQLQLVNSYSLYCQELARGVSEYFLKHNIKNTINEMVKSQFENLQCQPPNDDKDACSYINVVVGAACELGRKILPSAITSLVNASINNYADNLLSYANKLCEPIDREINNKISEYTQNIGEIFSTYVTILRSVLWPQGYRLSGFYVFDQDQNGASRVCSAISKLQTVQYLRFYAVRLLDAVEEGLYIPSYFLSAYPIQFKESPTVRWCYSVVVSPYYIYAQPPLPTSENEVKTLLIDALDVIRDNDNLGSEFLNFLKNRYVRTIILRIPPIPLIGGKSISWEGDAVKDNKVACNPRWEGLLPPRFNPYLNFNDCWDRGNLRWTIYSLELGQLSQNDKQFLGKILMQRARMIDVPVLTGVNKYFDTFKVYPAMAVREVGNPNPYYFVVPYSTPARELFVLGTVGDVVVYDGDLRGSGGGGKPFLYYDVSR